MPRAKKALSSDARGRLAGYRSGLEDKIVAELKLAGIVAAYEAVTIYYTKPAKASRYTPDFVLPNGIIIETKGRFVTADRQKHRFVREQHPDLDIRFVFSNSKNRIGKTSKTTYGMWCDHIGIKYADKSIPAEWLAEPPNKARLAALAKVTKKV